MQTSYDSEREAEAKLVTDEDMIRFQVIKQFYSIISLF